MENATSSPEPDAASRRRSGRVVKAPEKFSPEPAQAAKRKRTVAADGDDDDDVENDSQDDDAEMSDATEGGDQPARRSKPRSKPASRAKKPAMKKPKTNGVSLGQAAHLPSRPKKAVALKNFARPGDDDLYADVFASQLTTDEVASQWLQKYQENDARAVMDLVNFVLRSCGCDLQVTEDDIRDPDNSEDRLTELQELYKEERISEYPLISRAKDTRSFRELFTEFFVSLIEVLHETDVLYKDQVLMENISRWIASMSTSSLRPFRHTATTAILSLVSGLVNVAGVLDKRISQLESQLGASQKSKSKAKAQESQRNLAEANDFREQCDLLINDLLDITFAHRYRDVDPRIRTECAEALGHWITELPNVFMQPNHLRYLGWMLSDVVASTRVEVLRQLGRILKDSADQLGHFIERFQARLVEMASKDADVSVRVAAVGVIDILRASGLLTPEEVDIVGRMIFDSEPRVRKATAKFFDACVDDLIDAKVQDAGGAEAVEEVLGAADEDDFETPRSEWLNIKSLAELLSAYDKAIQAEQMPDAGELITAADVFQSVAPQSRITVAAQALYEKVPVIKEWELLAGYLLYDHTISAKSKSKAGSRSPENVLKKAVAPDSDEEAILLEVMAAAMGMALSQTHEVDKSKKRAGRHEATDAQEETALELAALIPRLLSKFGAQPATAKIVLRMEHILKPDVFQQLRQDSSRYEQLLDGISTQFDKHSDKEVLAEATASLSHARQHDDLEELVDGKLSVLWENTMNTLRNFDRTCDLSERGSLNEEYLQDLTGVIAKMSSLASISDCVDIMETPGRTSDSELPAIEILVNMINRGTFTEITDRIEELEDEVVTYGIRAAQFYFMWKLRGLEKLIRTGSDVSDAEITRLHKLRKIFTDNLINTLSSRMIVDETRLLATGSLCDTHVLFASLNTWIASSGQEAKYKKLKKLVDEIPTGLIPELISIFDGTERNYAKRAKKTLNEPAEDEVPVDDEPDDDEQDDDDENLPREQQFVNELKAEHALCELTGKYVMAIARKVLDHSGDYAGRLRKRLLRNQSKLGKNYHEVVAYLDPRRRDEILRRKGKAAKAAPKKAPVAEQQPAAQDGLVIEGDDIEDPFDDDEPAEGSREDLRRRELLIEDDEEEEEEEAERRKSPSPDADSVLGD